jgi:hypothetical protein
MDKNVMRRNPTKAEILPQIENIIVNLPPPGCNTMGSTA